jgi:FkbM family methyltransferase
MPKSSKASTSKVALLAAYTSGVATVTLLFTMHTVLVNNTNKTTALRQSPPVAVAEEPVFRVDKVVEQPSKPTLEQPPPRAAANLQFAEFCDISQEVSPVSAPPFFPYSPPSVAELQSHQCSWAKLLHSALPPNLEVCTMDPKQDTHISAELHHFGRWMQDLETGLLVGTQMCTADRPWFIDVGAHFGSVGVVAGAHGCNVMAFEPYTEALPNLYQTFQRQAAKKPFNYHIYNNAVHGRVSRMYLMVYNDNVGAASVFQSAQIIQEGATMQRVIAIKLDDIGHMDDAPTDQSGKKLDLSRIHLVKIAAETSNVEILYGMREMISVHKVPYILLTISAPASCHLWDMLQYMYASGYAGFEYLKGMNLNEWRDRISDPDFRTSFVVLVHEEQFDLGMLPAALEESAEHAFGRTANLQLLIKRNR